MSASAHQPPPGSRLELDRFARLQLGLAPMFERVFADNALPRTVVVVPSLSLDPDGLAKIPGVEHYEERMLCLLMLLRLPRARVVYLTSRTIDPAIVDYYLHLLPGVPFRHARARLTMLDCGDGGTAPLTQKILERPGLMDRIRAAVTDPTSAHMTCFNATELERTLAVRLGMPLYACDPALAPLGNKSNGRDLFRATGIAMPEGMEHLRSDGEVVAAVAELKARNPGLRRAVVKLNEGFSGEGNAVLPLDDAPARGVEGWLRAQLRSSLQFEAVGETYDRFFGKFADMGGIVEEFLEAPEVRSPSVQCRIDPFGSAEVISTHDQLLGGPSGQVYLGCTFPADAAYRLQLHDATQRVADALAGKGVIGRFSLDFVSVRRESGWEHHALDLNLRKGGTTLPFLMLQFLTNGTYDIDEGIYRTPTGRERYYRASDNLESPRYREMTPEALIDLSVTAGLHFDASRQQGVVFHLMGALPEHGKVGVVCIGETPSAADALYTRTVEELTAAT